MDEKNVDDLKDDVAYLFNKHIMSIQHFWYACISHVQQELFLLSLRKHIFAFENL